MIYDLHQRGTTYHKSCYCMNTHLCSPSLFLGNSLLCEMVSLQIVPDSYVSCLAQDAVFSGHKICYLTNFSVFVLLTPPLFLLVHLLLCSWSGFGVDWHGLFYQGGLSRQQARMWETHKRSRIELVRTVHPLNPKVIYSRLAELLKLGKAYYTHASKYKKKTSLNYMLENCQSLV